MSSTKKPLVLSWSSGKDSAWALHRLASSPTHEVVGLLTTINETHERVAMHAVRDELLQRQARALGLPLHRVGLPHPCTNEIYEERMAAALKTLVDDGVRAMAFGDLFLEDVRAFRVQQLEGLPIEPVFPVWGLPTRELAREMVASGVEAIVTCLDPRVMPRELAGATYDASFLDRLPEPVDPCGENGEFHTFTIDGPAFSERMEVIVGETVEREGFVFTDVLPAN